MGDCGASWCQWTARPLTTEIQLFHARAVEEEGKQNLEVSVTEITAAEADHTTPILLPNVKALKRIARAINIFLRCLHQGSSS